MKPRRLDTHGRAVCLVFLFCALLWSGFGCGNGTDDPNPDAGDGGGDADGDADGDGDEELDGDASLDGDLDADGDILPWPTFEFDPARMFDDVAWLADEDRAGRAPGTEGNDLSVDRVEELFADLGLQPAGDDDSFRQLFEFAWWQQGEDADVVIEGSELEEGPDYFVIPYSGAAEITADIVFAGYGLTVPPFDAAVYPDCPLDPAVGWDDYEGIDVTDRIVLVMRHGPGEDESIHDDCPGNEACVGMPCLWNFGYKTANAHLHGAAAVIIVQDYRHGPSLPEGATITEEYYQSGVAGLFLDRGEVEEELPELEVWAEAIESAMAPAPVDTEVTMSITVNASLDMIEAPNILGVVEGTDPELGDEVIVVGAHVDHVGIDAVTGEVMPGADDNASGTAVMMELARAMAGSGIEPARSVLFASWNAEELGLIGSCYYVGSPTLPLDTTIAAFSVDMVGAGVPSGVDLYGGRESMNRWMAELMEAATIARGLDYEVGTPAAMDASDHACFFYAGIPAVLVSTQGPHRYYHTPQDTADTIDPDNLETAAELMWSILVPLTLGTEDHYLGE